MGSKEETHVAFTMNPLNFAIFSSSLLISAQCSLICPDVTTKPDFDPSRYLGDWYQMEGTVAFFAPEGSHCIRATYGDRGDGTVSVHNVVTKEGKSPNEICGYATIPDIDNEQEDWLSTSRMSQLLETTEFWTLIMKTGLLSIHAAILTYLVFLDTHIS